MRDQRAAAGFPKQPQVPPPLSLATIRPMTINQNRVFKEFYKGQHLLLHGYAGTGKSFLSLYLALHEALVVKAAKRVIVVRSAVPSRTQGFLPGTEQEKAAIYEIPYAAIVDDLFGKAGSYNRLKDQKTIEFTTTSYLRGLTIAMQAPAKLLADAIREVETLREENARLRAALKPFIERLEVVEETIAHKYACGTDIAMKHLRAARDAIREGGKDD